MADSNSSRSPRADDPQPRSVDDSLRGSDPLAELARLIGQSDPFADFEGGRVRGEAQDGGRTPAVPPEDWPPPAASPEPHHHGAGAPQAAPEDIAYPPPGYAPPGPAEPYAPYPDEAYGYPAEAYQEGEQPYYEPYYDPDDSFEEADYLEEHDRKRRRTRLAAVAAVLALVILGGAGAYGYRTFFGTAMRDAPPPVIKADTTPAKVIPEARGSGSGSNKLIYDRVGQNQGGEEKIVPREEKPVDIKTATVTPPASAAAPSASANAVAAPPPVTIPVTGQSPSGQVLPVASEPTIAARGTGAILPSAKKVRTVTIRPSDMTIVPESAARTAEPEPPPAPQSAQPPEPPAPPERSARGGGCPRRPQRNDERQR